MPGLDRVMLAQEFPFDGSLQTSELHVSVQCAEGELADTPAWDCSKTSKDIVLKVIFSFESLTVILNIFNH